MYPLKKRIISACLSAMLVSSAITGLTVMSNADNSLQSVTAKFVQRINKTEPADNKKETDINDFEYHLNQNNSVYIEKYNGNETDIVIPAKINGKKVTRIAYYAFEDNKTIKSVTIPDTVTEIGDKAFAGCISLNKIVLMSDTVAVNHYAIENTAFYNDKNNWDNGVLYLDNYLIQADPEIVKGDYTVKNGTTAIADYAFKECKLLTSVTIPKSVTNFGSEYIGNIFSNCSNLKTVTINAKITQIPSGTFYGCEALTTIALPSGLKEMGYNAFSGCSSLESVSLPDTLELIEGYAFSNCVKLKSVKIPNSVKEIEGGAFTGCSSLTSVTIPSSVTHIAYELFSQCTALSDINLPDTITKIESSAFTNTAFVNDKSNWDGKLLYIGNYLYDSSEDISGECTIKDGTTLIADGAFTNRNVSSINLPDSLKHIGWTAFSGCSSLTSFTLPNSVYDIGSAVFKDCQSLKTVVLPNGIDFIPAEIFSGCSQLNDITIPETVKTIEENAFMGCSSLTGIIIPDSVKTIENFAFSGCSSLTDISIPSTTEDLGNCIFTDCASLKSLNVDDKNKNYKDIDGVLFDITGKTLIAYPASKADSDYTIPDSVEVINSRAFYKNKYIKNIDMHDNVIEIGSSAFSGCKKLNSIKLSDNVTALNSALFYDCENLTDISLGNNITEIYFDTFDNSGFANDDSNYENGVLYLNNYLIKAKANEISGEYAIKDGTKVIADWAFIDCTNLTSVSIPTSVKYIGQKAFINCGLTEITVPANVIEIGNNALGYKKDPPHIPMTGLKSFSNVPNYIIDNFVITGYSDTEADRYANKYGYFKFVSLGIFECDHSDTITRNISEADCYRTGYTGDLICYNCGKLISMGNNIGYKHDFVDGVCTICYITDANYEKPNEPVTGTPDEPSSSVTDKPSSTPSENESTTKEPSTSPSENGIKLMPDSILKVDESKSNITFIPSSTLGMTVSELRKQIDGDITVALDDDALIANGTKITCGGVTYILTVKGDAQADGKITASDARAILRIAAKLDTADGITTSAADINSDGKVTSSEARSVLRFSAKLAKTIES